MNKNEIYKKITTRETLTAEVPDYFIQNMVRAEKELFNKLNLFVKNIKLDGNAVANSPANIQKANSARRQIRKWMREAGYYDALSEYADGYNSLFAATRDYYRAAGLKSTFTERDFESLSKIKTDDITFLKNIDTQVEQEVYNFLFDSVYSNKDYTRLQAKLLELVKGNKKKLGVLTKYTKTRAVDAFASFDRQLQNVKSAELGLEYFYYSGVHLQTTRKFCRDHKGKVYHKRIIDGWESQTWTGKNTRASVWKALGGYNCVDILSPMTRNMAERLGIPIVE